MFAAQSAMVYKQAKDIALQKKVAEMRNSSGKFPELENAPFSLLEMSAWTNVGSDDVSTVSGSSNGMKKKYSSAWDDENFGPTWNERWKARAEEYLSKVIEDEEHRLASIKEAMVNDKELIHARADSGCKIGVVLSMNILKRHECEYANCNMILVMLKELAEEIESTNKPKGLKVYRDRVRSILEDTPLPKPGKTYTLKEDADTIIKEALALVFEF